MKSTLIFFLFIGLYFTFVPDRNLSVDDKFNIYQINLLDKFSINGKINVIEIKKNSLNYKVVNKNHRNYDFYVNANYFTIDNIPVGEVIINGKIIKKKNSFGGFFTTDGKTPKFYYNNRPNGVLYSSQTHTPIIMNGVANKKIFTQRWAKYKLPRLIIGRKKNNDIIVIHTVDNTKCSVSDFYKISKSLGLVDALMLDGGASIEVGLTYGDINYKYQIVSDLQRKIGKVPTPSVFIVGTFN